MTNLKLALMTGATIALMGSAALASPTNQGPPPGSFFSLTGLPINHTYEEFTTSFVATTSQTYLTFAFREDPAFISLDDVSLSTGGGPNLLVNGGFEDGPLGASAPTGWTYLNIYGAEAGGVVANNNPHSGSNNYYDGAVQAYDAITQVVATTPGATYDVSFWESDNSSLTVYQPLSTNGDVTDTGGNGADLFLYEGPTIPPGVPELGAWALMLVGFAGTGLALRGRKARIA